MADEEVLLEAEFNPRVCTYWLMSGALVLTFTIVGIVLLPVWFIVGQKITQRYLERMRCRLTKRALKMEKGYFVRVEKSVPLDKITDLGLVQGPIMRYLDIEAISVETAGQSGVGALLTLTGIRDGRKFRDAVLKRRDEVVAAEAERQTPTTPAVPSTIASSADSDRVLTEIRDSVVAIRKHLEARAE